MGYVQVLTNKPQTLHFDPLRIYKNIPVTEKLIWL